MSTATVSASEEPEASPDAIESLRVAVLRPVRAHHAFEACVEQLGTAIRLGVYPRGSTLPTERDLAARLAVSRATLREAMAALREAGLVRTSRGRGGGSVVVLKAQAPAKVSARRARERRSDWIDALDFRRVVEPGACALAAGRELDDASRRSLEEAHEAVSAARQPAAHRQADSRLHLILAALSGSARMVAAVTSAQADMHEMLGSIPVLEANIAHSDAQHVRIVEAVLDGDAGRARRAMEQHCDDTAALLHGLLG